MKRTDQQFFSLLRAGLWGTPPDAALFDGPVDWEAIYETANRQTLLGFVGDGIALQVAHSGIPEADKAPVDIRKKFLVQVVKAERRNEKLNQFIVRFNRIFSEAGIVPVIVKGQGVALAYRQPMHRQSGDIDYLLTPEDYTKAKEILTPLASEVEAEGTDRLHFNCTVEGITVELHGTEDRIHHTRGPERKFDDFTTRHYAAPMRYWDLDGEKIPLMDHHFSVIYILEHFHHHMMTSGVGLRQICDWIMYISEYRDALDEAALEADLKDLSLLRPWKVYAALAVSCLGMPAERMPLYDPSFARYNSRVWRIIAKTGNFGKYERKRPPMSVPRLLRKIKSFAYILKQTARLLPIFPSESLRTLLRRIKTGFQHINEF
ncbi:MAG: nucleotidyltransferase family protein [Bacteroidales bacterium]|nr:nucleotidyltransferase family protein [Bacteroidales bacterium]